MGAWNILDDAYKFAKRGGIIPSETKSGQLSMLPHNYGAVKTPKPMTAGELHSAVLRGIKESSKPPFTPSGRVSMSEGTARARVKLAARTQELAQKRAKAGVGRPVPGSITRSNPRPRRVGPLSAGEAKVDDLFGVPWGK